MIPTKIGNQSYVAVFFCDSLIYSRLTEVVAQMHSLTGARSADNPYIKGVSTVEYDGMIFINAPYLNVFRPTAGTNSVVWGPIGETNIRTANPRKYVNNSQFGLMIGLGGGALCVGTDREVTITKVVADHDKGMGIAGHVDYGTIRTEWWCNDGTPTTDPSSCINNSSIVVIAFEPGI